MSDRRAVELRPAKRMVVQIRPPLRRVERVVVGTEGPAGPAADLGFIDPGEIT